MGAETAQDWQKAAASALEWWRDAGLDMLVEEAARDWTARPPARPPAATPDDAAAAAASAPAATEALPDTLEAFVAWRLGADAPEAGWMSPRIPPAGSPDAEWTILVDMPEAEDTDTLMSGPAGRMLDRMLLAVGLSRAQVYLGSLAVARPVTGQIPAQQTARLIQLARHHLALLRPRKLLLLGRATSRAVPETGDQLTGDHALVINQFGPDCRVVATHHPRVLLDHPGAKRETWRHLLLLQGGTE